MNAKDKTVIRIFSTISAFCGILPSEKPSRLFYSYQIFIFTFTLLCNFFCLYNNIVTYSFGRDSLDAFITALATFNTIILSFAFQFPVLWYAELWRNFNQKLKAGCSKTPIRSKIVFLEVFAAHIFFFGRLFLITYGIISMAGIRVILKNFSRPLTDYYSMIFTLNLVHINIVIKKKFSYINIYLRRTNCVRHVQKLYIETIKLIQDFNNYFGCQILFITARGISVILQCLHGSLKDIQIKNTKTENAGILFWSWFYSSTVFVSKIHKM